MTDNKQSGLYAWQVFNSSGDTRRGITIREIVKHVNNDAILLTRVRRKLPSNIDLRPVGKIGGGEAHRLLAAIAYAFLADKGLKPLCEQWVNGKRVDVVSHDRQWLIECGDTQADVVLEHLANAQYFCVLPFEAVEGQQFLMYEFTRGKNWEQAYQKAQSDSAAAWDKLTNAISNSLGVD